MEIGYKITKPVETQEQCDSYAEVAKWCNDNNATIEDKGEYYEVVENKVADIPVDTTPTMGDRMSATEEAIAEIGDMLAELLGGAE